MIIIDKLNRKVNLLLRSRDSLKHMYSQNMPQEIFTTILTIEQYDLYNSLLEKEGETTIAVSDIIFLF